MKLKTMNFINDILVEKMGLKEEIARNPQFIDRISSLISFVSLSGIYYVDNQLYVSNHRTNKITVIDGMLLIEEGVRTDSRSNADVKRHKRTIVAYGIAKTNLIIKKTDLTAIGREVDSYHDLSIIEELTLVNSDGIELEKTILEHYDRERFGSVEEWNGKINDDTFNLFGHNEQNQLKDLKYIVGLTRNQKYIEAIDYARVDLENNQNSTGTIPINQDEGIINIINPDRINEYIFEEKFIPLNEVKLFNLLLTNYASRKLSKKKREIEITSWQKDMIISLTKMSNKRIRFEAVSAMLEREAKIDDGIDHDHKLIVEEDGNLVYVEGISW